MRLEMILCAVSCPWSALWVYGAAALPLQDDLLPVKRKNPASILTF